MFGIVFRAGVKQYNFTQRVGESKYMQNRTQNLVFKVLKCEIGFILQGLEV